MSWIVIVVSGGRVEAVHGDVPGTGVVVADLDSWADDRQGPWISRLDIESIETLDDLIVDELGETPTGLTYEDKRLCLAGAILKALEWGLTLDDHPNVELLADQCLRWALDMDDPWTPPWEDWGIT